MTAKHTPGPWRVDGGSVTSDSLRTQDSIVDIWRDDAVDKADLALIAAAPELLAALELALNFIENTEGEIGAALTSGDVARAAIAKAKGQTQ